MSTGGAFEEEYEEAAPPKKELFYTEGSALLKQARLHIAHFSLDRAAARLAGAKRKRESPDEDEIAEQADTIRLMCKVLFITLVFRACVCCHIMKGTSALTPGYLSAESESAKELATSTVGTVVYHKML